jgi:DNA polymerase family A
VSQAEEQQNAEEAPKRIPQVFRTPDGHDLSFTPAKKSRVDKFDKDVLAYWHGQEEGTVRSGPKAVAKRVTITTVNPEWPLGDDPLKPGIRSPVCANCELHLHGGRNPFIPYQGAEDPLVTIIFDGVTRAEDIIGDLGSDGSPRVIARIIEESQIETGVKLSDVRWVPLTRCCNWKKKMADLKSRGNWCRYHVVDDIMRHPPALIMPVGSVALGRLSHKSNAQEWSGRLLTYRGWPDDWLTNPKYALSRPDPLDPANPDKSVIGHPVFGPLPEWHIPMVPVQAPRLIQMTQNPTIYNRWRKSIIRALKLAKDGVRSPNYTRPWYRFTDDIDLIEKVLSELPPGIKLCYDTETTGLRPWATIWTKLGDGSETGGPDMLCEDGRARIVSMMFRWVDSVDGKPRSIGFPWDLRDDPANPDKATVTRLKRLTPLVWKVLCQSTLIGHNLTFDMLFSWATLNHDNLMGWDDTKANRVRDQRICALANACKFDTWHMAFTWMQRRGSLGLEAMAYEWVPELAGYEEEFTLLIDLHYEDMHPAANKGGHYLRCPKGQEKKLETYVMGDVEVAYKAYEHILDKLRNSKTYEIPIADPANPGKFRWFEPPNRNWVYHKVISPASRVLMTMMARGLYIDQSALARMSVEMPSKIKALREKICKDVDERIGLFIETMKQGDDSVDPKIPADPNFELDLENKTHLKKLLFEVLDLPVQRLTKQGKKLHGDNLEEVRDKAYRAVIETMPEIKGDDRAVEHQIQLVLREFAAVDKFTLNKLTVQFEKLRPLRDYRKLFKLYSTYVRPLKNILTTNLDKKARKSDPHLCFDGCIHASFLLTGTRGGRLSCKDPNLQQLPRDGEVKSMFVSRFGKRGCMYQGDLSQIELRLLAAASGDPTMVKAYFDGIDLHSLTASRIFGVPYEHFTKDYMKFLQSKGKDEEAKLLELNRVTAKTTNFLTGYGGGAFGLQNVLTMNNIDKPIEECEKIIELFFDSYPSIRNLLQFYKKFILETDVAVSVFGRVRVFEEVRGDDREAKAKALRAGCNHLIQSTASDMMLTALFSIENLMRHAGLESILVSTVHDSLVIDCVREELPEVHDIVTLVLNNFPEVFKSVFGPAFDTSWMIVPFSGDCEVGTDYLHVKKIPSGEANRIDWNELLSAKAH